MNVIADNSEFNLAAERQASVLKVETYWGYIIRCQSCDRTMAILMQWFAAIVGVSLLVSTLGLWVLPGSNVSQDVIGFKIGVSTVMAVFGMVMVWYASYGTHYETQIDLARTELREALRNNRGVARVQNRVKFEDIDAIYIDRSAGAGEKVQLLVRLAASSDAIVVATDYEEHLSQLHARLQRDILGLTIKKPVKANRGFKLKGAMGVVPPLLAA